MSKECAKTGEIGWKPKYATSPMQKKHQNLRSNNNDAHSITKYGFLVRPNAQIVALRAHCAKGAPSVEGHHVEYQIFIRRESQCRLGSRR